MQEADAEAALGWAWVQRLYLVRARSPGPLHGLDTRAEKPELWPRTCWDRNGDHSVTLLGCFSS